MKVLKYVLPLLKCIWVTLVAACGRHILFLKQTIISFLPLFFALILTTIVLLVLHCIKVREQRKREENQKEFKFIC